MLFFKSAFQDINKLLDINKILYINKIFSLAFIELTFIIVLILGFVYLDLMMILYIMSFIILELCELHTLFPLLIV